jgi:putative ABC transport system permease protein
MLFDLRNIVRSLTRAKGFTIVTILTLALGIGASGAIFSVVDRILFKDLPFPRDVYVIGARDKKGAKHYFRIDEQFRAYRDQTNVFAQFCLTSLRSGNVAIAGQPVATNWMGVSANFFQMIRVGPVKGRAFAPDEDQLGRNNVVVITDRFWRQHFQGAPDILGRQIEVNGVLCSVVGVLRRNQVLPAYAWADVYQPLSYLPDPHNPWDPSLMILTRLKSGVSVTHAESAMAGVTLNYTRFMAQFFDGQSPALFTMAEVQRPARAEVYWVLLAAVAFLYAIACLNSTNLMLVRMLGRQRELSLRLALGAGRGQLIRLFFLESLMIALIATALGVVLANALIPFFTSLAGNSTEHEAGGWSLDWRALSVLAGLSLLTAVLIAAVPALRILRNPIYGTLKEGGAAIGESRRLAMLRGGFVVLQATFAVILLAGAGLMVRTFSQLQRVSLGFDPNNLIKVKVGFPATHSPEKDQRLAVVRRIQEQLRRLPGVVSAAYGSDNLLCGFYFADNSVYDADGVNILKVAAKYVSPNFHETVGLTVKRGTWFKQVASMEIMISESLARARFGSEDPIGKPLKSVLAGQPGYHPWVVVGVIGDVRETVREPPGFVVYGPEFWYPPVINTFILKVSGSPSPNFAGLARRAIYELDPQLVTDEVISLNAIRDRQIAFEMFALSVLKVLSGLAMALTVVGLFSVLAYTVDRRMAEFGLRLALGATRGNLVRLVMRRGVVLTLIGVAVGIAGALVLTRFLRSVLFEVSPYDPMVFGTVAVLLVIAAVLACALPALRATRADITRLLRSE